MVILVTGFEPFGKMIDNPSQSIIEHLLKQNKPNIFAQVLPVDYQLAGKQLLSLIHDLNPDAVVMLGLAQGRKHISLERIAININDANMPDNEGKLVRGKKIANDAPVGYWSTLPLEEFYQAVESASIPVKYSNHAGAYLCNHVMYSALHHFADGKQSIPCGFIHVPTVETVALKAQIHAIDLCLGILSEEIMA
ncbi:MAG: pyroglutamyl-peptidase I [Phototrophicaceae bacterium]